MNSDAAPKHGGSGGGELERRLAGVETRLDVIEKTMVSAEAFTRELGGVRGDIAALRDELHVGLGDAHRDMNGEIGGVRSEIASVRGEVAALRDELHVGLGDVRREMNRDLGGMREEMQREFGAVRVDIAKLPFELVKWLIALSGIAAAIATTIYNFWFR